MQEVGMLAGTLILAEYYRFDKKNAMNLSHSKQTPPSHLYSKTLYVSNNLTASLGYSIPGTQIKFNETVTLSPLQDARAPAALGARLHPANRYLGLKIHHLNRCYT